MAVVVRDRDQNEVDIWVFDTVDGARQRLTFDGAAKSHPTWSSDGQWLAYSSENMLRIRPADGTGKERRIGDGFGYELNFSPDGRTMALTLPDAQAAGDLWYAEHADSIVPVPFLITAANEANPRIAPSGDFIA